MRQYKTIIINNEKIYQYQDKSISRLRLPDYCPKCKKRETIFLSINENENDILRCSCGYNKISPSIK